MVYQDVMVGKRCENASDFVQLIRDKNIPMIVDQLLISEIDDTGENRTALYDNVKTAPNIQKIHYTYATC
ncbi:unnamed protein product [Rotaria sp. Silwood2]|nr:unnamed protein product [Rotaria sp. Silwood2]CAF2728336.1 unnamed protein product [Rotaria sp. Silwood2]CAF2750286.1 unnamed protein product [Rotaria sp. Silwood2]CAF3139123.1 unnamed protein product [Rotaria sp. Silwood2]CAF3857527.1 unnamed protein product [Rotaria sp. Silwood2]